MKYHNAIASICKRENLRARRLESFSGCWTAIFLLIGNTLLNHQCFADRVAILYPDIREPYKQVFLNITSGVEEVFPEQVMELAIQNNTGADDVDAWLAKNQANGIIALGRAGIRSIESLNLNVPTVVGAVVIRANHSNFTGISLNPSPKLLFQSMQSLIPDLSTIHVVYQRDSNAWTIDRAKSFAAELGLTLHATAVDDLRSGAEAYREIQNKMGKKTHALWLPVGAPSRDSAILQNILATAWRKDQIVFSSNLADVRRGVLFSMYPDNKAMGKELAHLLKKQQQHDGNAKENEILLVSTLLTAINLRTAEHIGLSFTREQMNAFDYVYPEQ